MSFINTHCTEMTMQCVEHFYFFHFILFPLESLGLRLFRWTCSKHEPFRSQFVVIIIILFPFCPIFSCFEHHFSFDNGGKRFQLFECFKYKEKCEREKNRKPLSLILQKRKKNASEERIIHWEEKISSVIADKVHPFSIVYSSALMKW